MVLWLHMWDKEGSIRVRVLTPVERLCSCLQALCAKHAGFCSCIRTPWRITPPMRTLNESAPRIMQLLVPWADLPLVLSCSTVILDPDYHWGWTRTLWIKGFCFPDTTMNVCHVFVQKFSPLSFSTYSPSPCPTPCVTTATMPEALASSTA